MALAYDIVTVQCRDLSGHGINILFRKNAHGDSFKAGRGIVKRGEDRQDAGIVLTEDVNQP